MKIEETRFEYFIDYINNRIHLLDCDNSVANSLINNISPEFQAKMIEDECLMLDVLDFEWICYGQDGLIVSYKDYNVKILNPKLPNLHKPYKVVMETRKKRFGNK